MNKLLIPSFLLGGIILSLGFAKPVEAETVVNETYNSNAGQPI